MPSAYIHPITYITAAVLTFFLVGCGAPAESQRAQQGAYEAFHLSEVRLLDGPFKHAQDTNLEYLLELDPDRFLAPYLREAGLEPRAESYGNWENSGLDGHIGGHYLSALAMMYASTGHAEIHRRLTYMIDELERVQEAHGDGYIGGVPDGRATWDEIRRGDIRADLFSLNGKWVPWYNVHKVYAGLRDAYTIGGNEKALDLLVGLTDWAVELVSGLSDEQIQSMLRSEHGGMNEVFADAAELTGDERYLHLARQFSHELILEPLLNEEDQLTGLHANTQIPKAIGYKRIADVSGGADAEWDDAAAFFWDTVVNRRSIAIGGNSVREHFHPADDYSAMVEDAEGPETCNTYNMLRLAQMLYATRGGTQYLDYNERALFNHILSTQHPEHGGLVYFTSMRPGHFRMYSQPEHAMWCCVGSGIENHSKYGEFIYNHRGDELYVNLFVASRLNWSDKDVVIEQTTAFPAEEATTIRVISGGEFGLNLRVPSWIDGASRVAVNGEEVSPEQADGFIRIHRDWAEGDVVSYTLPMQTHLEQLPDGSNYYAVLHGPIVLASKIDPFPGEQLNFLSDDGRMSHIAHGPMCPPEAAPMILGDPESFLASLEPVDGRPLTFRADEGVEGYSNLELIPFYQLHDSRYVVYWPQGSAEDLLARAESERDRLELEARTVDYVSPGQQQPESDHFFAGERTEAGIYRGRHWRHAEGWFSYQLRDPQGEASILRIELTGEDAGRTFDILINGELLETLTLEERNWGLYTLDFELPQEMIESADGVYEVRFEAAPGSIAGGLFDVRLLRE